MSQRLAVIIALHGLFLPSSLSAAICGKKLSTAAVADDTIAPSQLLPVVVARGRMQLSPYGPNTHRFSDHTVSLRERVWVDYEFRLEFKSTAPGEISLVSFSTEPSSITAMEKALWGRILRAGRYVGFERQGGPILLNTVDGFNGVGELFSWVTAERMDHFTSAAAPIFNERCMRFHFDQHIGSDCHWDQKMDFRRARNGVDKVSLQLQTPAGPASYFNLKGYSTRAVSSEHDQVIAIGPKFRKSATHYRAQLQSLGFEPEFIDQLPAGARLVFLSRALEVSNGRVTGSLMLIFPFDWLDHFGTIALKRLIDQPRSRPPVNRLSPRLNPVRRR